MAERIYRPLAQMRRCLLTAGTVLSGASCGGGGDITTPTTGSLAITTTTSGPEPDPDGYAVSIDNGAESPLGANASMQRDDLEPGPHSVRLAGISANCTLVGDNPRAINVSSGETATVAFQATCVTTSGSLQITAATSGESPDPDGYTVAVDAGTAQAIGPNATLSVVVSPGAHQITLGGIASNCRVEGDNPQSVSVIAGPAAKVAFAIACSAAFVLKIAFIDYESEDGQGNVYVGNLDGSRRRLTDDLDYSQLNWSPDGQKIAASGRRFSGGGPDVYVINADGSGKTKLTNNPQMDDRGIAGGACPAWSPDGRKIAFNRLGIDTRNDIYVMNSDGSGLANLTNHSGNDGCPFWSPDGSKIAFVAVHENEFGYYDGFYIYVVNADGSGRTNLTPNTAWQDGIVWSPDGRRIAYTGFRVGDPNPYNIYVTNVDGSGESILRQHPEPAGSSGNPLWSPDGRLIAFMSCAILGCEVFTINADGTGQRNLTNSLENVEGAISWSPDGSQILFSSDAHGDAGGWWVMNLDGTGRTRLGRPAGGAGGFWIWWR